MHNWSKLNYYIIYILFYISQMTLSFNDTILSKSITNPYHILIIILFI